MSSSLMKDNTLPYRMEILNNIWLFVPLGAIVYRIYPKWRVALVPVVISVAVEATQYLLSVGVCELDDVISNGLGGIIGVMACYLVRKFIKIVEKEPV